MSLVNQVLNRLEQRSADTALDQTQVRAVPPQAGYRWIKPMVLALVLLAVLATAAWLLGVSPKKPEVQTAAPQRAVSEPVSPDAMTPVRIEEGVATKKSFELSTLPLSETPPERKTAKPRKPVGDHPAGRVRTPKSLPTVPKPAMPETAAPRAAAPKTLPLKQISRTQRADAEYRKALALQQQGRATEALAGYAAALELNAQHEKARLAQAVLLAGNNRSADAERLLQEGLTLKPAHTGFSMLLARVQVERGDLVRALETLQTNLLQAGNNSDYQAFYAALLQRAGRHEEAVTHYRIAVQRAPNNGIWLMGYGISLQAVQRSEDAQAAYRQALASRSLSPELTAFVQQKLDGL